MFIWVRYREHGRIFTVEEYHDLYERLEADLIDELETVLLTDEQADAVTKCLQGDQLGTFPDLADLVFCSACGDFEDGDEMVGTTCLTCRAEAA